jgi:hypothetical protein
MVDNRDGTFTATVPADWVRAKGSQFFRFFPRRGRVPTREGWFQLSIRLRRAPHR